MCKYIRTLIVFYDVEISSVEIPLFRGAVLKSIGDGVNLFYHNHTEKDSFRYSYPLIQYKRLGGKAAIVCVGDGVDVIGQFLSGFNGKLRLGKREVRCNIDKVVPSKILVQTWSDNFGYHISRWLPLNAKNYCIYRMIDDEKEKKKMLENILKANLLSLLKGLDIHIEKELLLKIINLSDSYVIYNKGVGLMAFNADFTCNLSIPNNLGVGKNASIGYGVVHQERKQRNENKISVIK